MYDFLKFSRGFRQIFRKCFWEWAVLSWCQRSRFPSIWPARIGRTWTFDWRKTFGSSTRMNLHTARRRFCNERTSEMEWIAVTRMGAEYPQMAMFKVAGNGTVDKVPGFWKTEWINRKRGRFRGGGIHLLDSTTWLWGRFDLEKQPQMGNKKRHSGKDPSALW